MTTTPEEVEPEPTVVPSGDPAPIPTEPAQPGEDPGVAPDQPEVEPPADPLP